MVKPNKIALRLDETTKSRQLYVMGAKNGELAELMRCNLRAVKGRSPKSVYLLSTANRCLVSTPPMPSPKDLPTATIFLKLGAQFMVTTVLMREYGF